MENVTSTRTSIVSGFSDYTGSFIFHAYQIPSKNPAVFGTITLLTAFILYGVYCDYEKRRFDLPHFGIPSGALGPWRAGFNYIFHSEYYLRGGYQKYGPEGQAFLIATIPRYVILLTDPEQIEELRRAKEHDLDFRLAIARRMSLNHIFDPSINGYGPDDTDYHMDVIRLDLTQRLSTLLPEVYEEASLAWSEVTNIGTEWTRVKLWDAMLPVISRISNRVFVGVPLCRNKEYLNIMLDFAKRVSLAALAADHMPWFLRRATLWYLLQRFNYIKQATKFLGPIFDERRKMQGELGEHKNKPDDAIQWFLDAVSKFPKGHYMHNNEQLAQRVMLFNFGSIHTTSLSIVHVLYDLVSHPEYIEPLREDIIAHLKIYGGFTKQSLTAMKKLDSVLKESLRYNGVATITMVHEAIHDYTFKSGKTPVTVPKGIMVGIPAIAIHRSEEIYGPDANEWKGFRFSDLREDRNERARHQMVTTSVEYAPFGHGIHACPGRFFASNKLKILLSHLLLKYHVRLTPEWGGKRPENKTIFGSIVADMTVELEFRIREDWDKTKELFKLSGA